MNRKNIVFVIIVIYLSGFNKLLRGKINILKKIT